MRGHIGMFHASEIHHKIQFISHGWFSVDSLVHIYIFVMIWIESFCYLSCLYKIFDGCVLTCKKFDLN